ncbi:hypothetical protein ACFOD9_00010 [Novosphingobium bradum]|uniref:HTH marR-type domain-containing protein n=1 Tax=Novosphingobium bradum TaxID=1737444 RepID=A0ABV7IIV7_9SPHN
MFQAALLASPPLPGLPADDALTGLMGAVARASARPRYAFMVLCLLAEVADAQGKAGPCVAIDGQPMGLRDWLSTALGRLAERDSRRRSLEQRVAADLAGRGELSPDPAQARAQIDQAVSERACQAGKTNLSRTVSELVEAGLLRRHYQGYRVDHRNRGGQRQAVYTLSGPARLLLRRRPERPGPVEQPMPAGGQYPLFAPPGALARA